MPRVDLKTSLGDPVTLGQELGRGGEGSVFAISQPGLCAKIYHHPLTLDRADKIRLMAGKNVAALSAVAAWPLDLISDARGHPVGLTMPKIEGKKDVHKLYSPKSRRAEFLRADWRFLIRASANIARAFAEVHQAGCVIGDVNHGSVLVAQDARATLIDCDSFQLVTSTHRYLCEVGVETYTPPELQGKSFKGVVRTTNQDNFGLAVLIFHLLMMGRHPFSGRYLGAGDMPIAKAIEERRFVYGARHAAVQMARPPGTPELAIVGMQAAALFETAFTSKDGSFRPTAKAWVDSLVRLESDTIQCKTYQAHWHHSSLAACPWCQMEGLTGTTLFPFVIQGTTGIASFDVASIARKLSSMGHLGPVPIIEKPAAEPAIAAIQARRERRKWQMGCCAVIVVGVLVGLSFGSILLVLGGAGVGFITYAALNSYDKNAKLFVDFFEEASKNWITAKRDWESRCGPEEFNRKKSLFENLKIEWDKLPLDRLRKIATLEGDRKRLQLERHLDSFYIEDATIPGIGRGKKNLLASEGVETAFDVVDLRLQSIPGFGPATRAKLLSWRQEIERGFVFDASKPIDPKDLMAVEQTILMERKSLEGRLQRLANDALQEHARVLAARIRMRPRLEAAVSEFAQAEADLHAVK